MRNGAAPRTALREHWVVAGMRGSKTVLNPVAVH
jgi:hypothetical protein